MVKMDLSEKDNLRFLREEINNGLKKILEKYDLEVHFGNLRYEADGSKFTCKLTVEQKMSNKQRFELTAKKMKIDPKLYGKIISLGGDPMRVVGLKPNARKNKVILENSNGTRYVTQLANVQ